MERIFYPGLWLFSVLAILAGSNTLISDVPVHAQCAKGCWFNGILFATLGELGARVALACLWFTVAGWIGFLALSLKRKMKSEQRALSIKNESRRKDKTD